MNRRINQMPWVPERYEEQERKPYRFESTRRDFLRQLGGGVFVALCFARSQVVWGAGQAQRAAPIVDPARPRVDDELLQTWIHIAKDSAVTVYCGKTEIGQGIRTSLTQALQDEFDVPTDTVHFVFADTSRCPYDAGTFGSLSTPHMDPQIRAIGACARQVLLDLAAERWQVAANTLRLQAGKIVDQSGQAITIGELVDGQELSAQVDGSVELVPADKWQASGQSLAKIGGRDFVTGKHVYTSDLWLEGLHYGGVLRPPSLTGELGEVDTSAAEQIAGVTVVREGAFVGVVAPDPYLVEQALAAIKITRSHNAGPSQEGWRQRLRASAHVPPAWRGKTAIRRGEPIPDAALELRATYSAPHIAHCPLEPRASVARWQAGTLELWVGTQNPFSVATDVAAEFGLRDGEVVLQVPDMGSGYGGKQSAETAIEAARLAKAAGVPVKVVWTREEEFTWAYFRPAAVVDAVTRLAGDGTLLGWQQTTFNGGLSGLATPYRVAAEESAFFASRADLRQGSYRAVGATVNHFARESAMDEAAIAAGQDPLAYRQANLDDERLLAVLAAAAERFGWGQDKAAKHGHGLAACKDKGGYLATCVEVRVDDDGAVELTRIVNAFECGAVVNPDNTINQIEGAVIMGLGGALWEEVVYENGTIKNPRFSSYRVPRISDVPVMETILLDRRDLPSAGAGECGVVSIAPALANAIADATGKRVRDLPLTPNGRLRG